MTIPPPTGAPQPPVGRVGPPVRGGRGPAVIRPRAAGPAPATPPAKPKPRRMAVVEDNLLAVMAAQSRFVAEFPFLAGFASIKRNCHTCGGRRKFADAAIKARQAIVGLDSQQRQRLKEMLNVEQLTVYVPDAQGKRQPVVF